MPATKTNIEPISVSVADAARLLGIKDRRTIYKLIHQGKIKARQMDRAYLVNYASLKAFAGEGGAR